MKAVVASVLAVFLSVGLCFAEAPREQIIHGYVIQKMEDGILVGCEADPQHFGVHHAEGVVFVSGKRVKDIFGGQHVHFRAQLIGRFTYTTVQGSESIVQEFKFD